MKTSIAPLASKFLGSSAIAVTACIIATSAQSAALAEQREWIIANAGRAVTLSDELAVTFHPTTNSVWLEQDGILTGIGTLVTTDDSTNISILWHTGETQSLPLSPPASGMISGNQHQLAEQYDRLLAAPLQKGVAQLPPGTLFETGGVLRMPNKSGPPNLGLWRARGPIVDITVGESTSTLSLADLLTPD